MQGGVEGARAEAANRSGTPLWAFAARVLAILIFVAATNSGFVQRAVLVVDQGRLITLAGFVGLWALSLACLFIAAFQPNRWVRAAWAVVIASSTAVGFAFRYASGSDLTIMDVLSLWSARHEAERAMDFYASAFILLLVVLVVGIAIFSAPPVPAGAAKRRWLTRLAWAPLVPIACTAVIVVYKEGGGAQALPMQFAPLSVAAVSGVAIAKAPIPERSPVAWQPQAAPVRRVVMLVDESIRADYIDWSPENPYTPELARLKPRLVDHGPAASGGVCSHYSNALLRFMAARQDVGRQLLANPSIWSYARKAGFRTIFVDAQAAFNRNPGKLQNFMTPDETAEIDAFHALPESVPVHSLDNRLLDIVLEELRSPGPVFIYANKNGAHFPYDKSYPASEAVFRPSMAEGTDDQATRVNSYRNAVRWTVDRFFKRLAEEADLSDTVVIYTSDHGQRFDPRRATHCSVDDPDPREALVPMVTMTGNESLRARLADGAERNRRRATHFLIAPTVLELLGYAPDQIRRTYGNGSLFETTGAAPTFTSGDIFKLFSSKVRLHPIDLTQPYLEHGWASAATMLRPTLEPAAQRGSRRPQGTSDDPN
jgi:glucan phosphoethanolaminetransferase (alkaline phosphatase superfamily)